jgi:hypothetical protein
VAANTIQLTGWIEFEQKCLDMSKILPKEMDYIAKQAAIKWENGAKLDAPKDRGWLAGGITSIPGASLGQWEVVSRQFYSPYQEWGTGSNAVIPVDLIDYAAQWWTHKVHVGIRPHVYFFVQKPIAERQLLDDLEQMINTPH